MFLTGFTSCSVLLLFPLFDHLLCLCLVFDSISSNIDEVLSINPSANVFVLGNFNVHHKDWLTYSLRTERSGELCLNFSISNDLTQMVNFPTWIPDCDSQSPAFLDLFISSDASICSKMVFHPVGNSDHVVISVSIDFPSYSEQDALFHGMAYHFSCADWDGLCDHLRNVPWEDIFNPLSANPTKWSNTLKQFVCNLPTNCLSAFDHFVKLALKGLNSLLLVLLVNLISGFRL